MRVADWWARRSSILLVAAVTPIAIAVALVSLRDDVDSANIALVLVVSVVAFAVYTGRGPAVVAAVSAALAFDFFHTKPYQALTIASRNDVETTALLLAVGLVVSDVAVRGRHAANSAEARRGEIRRIYRVAELAAKGSDPADVILATQAELIELLTLRDCRFEAPPFPTPLERIERGGLLSAQRLYLAEGGFELPAGGVELPVLGRGDVLGRFVLEPTPGVGVSLEQRVVAIALADQVGAALAAPFQRGGPFRG